MVEYVNALDADKWEEKRKEKKLNSMTKHGTK